MKRIALALLLAVGVAQPVYGASYDDLNAGIQLHNLGDWDGAIRQLDKVLAAGDLSPNLQFIAHFDRGIAHHALGQWDQAIQDYSASLTLRPGEIQVLFNRSSVYESTDKLDLAAADLDSAIAAHPLQGRPYEMRALLHVKRGEMEKAREDLTSMLKFQPDNSEYMNGISDWVIGQPEQAEKKFSYQTDKGPDKIYAWLWYALAEVHFGKPVPRRSLPDFPEKDWPRPLVAFFLGKASQESVFAASKQGDQKLLDLQICETNFYIGEWLLQHHDEAGAKPLLQKAASDCPPKMIEWMPAKMEQAKLQ